MKTLTSMISLTVICASLAACGTDHETVVHEQPVVQERVIHETAPAPAPVIVQGNGMSPSSVESNCAHGYDNQSHSCY